MEHTRIKLGIFCLLIAFNSLNLSCKSYSEEPETNEEPKTYCLNETLKSQLELNQMELGFISQQIELTGEVNYNHDQLYNFTSLINGFTERVLFSLGDKVSKGQVLAEIKSPDLNMMMTEKKNLQTKLKVAERELDAQERMFENNLSSERDLVTARAEVENLNAEYKNLSQNLNMFHPNPSKGTYEIKSPANGYITGKNINSGTQITEGMELFTISGLDNVWIMANVYATDLQFVEQGMDVKIKILAYPNEVFSGKITTLSKVFDNEERVLKARIEIPNLGLKLKPGMSADVIVEKPSNETAFAIPIDDIIFDNNRYFVIVYRSDCDIEVRELHIAARNHSSYFIKEGIKEGEKFVTQNQLLIYEKIK